ncbi:hypothetical protein NQ318_013640 [Aromia moschata]|uniref:Uncharacterized protein n=1 Tax=Aromia moschata TaxID=1265417 RepID=A0AAV8XIV9_9CUCU|nr:hypothetical protein NQ318_013640 [Aromia moschata]
MATRVNRKNATATVTKEVVAAESKSNKNEPPTETTSPKSAAQTGRTATSIAKRLAKKSPAKKMLKKPSMAIKLKAKSKKAVKLNPKLAKTILQNTKTLENRKKLLRNGAKEVKPKKKKAPVKKEKDDSPPVLEPIFPIEENLENKKQPKRRLTKKTLKASADLLDVKKIKIENDDDVSVASDVTDDLPNLQKQVRKPRTQKKPKVENDSLEDVMNDLSFLIKGEKDEIKKEIDSLSESGKSDTTTKPKKLTKRQRLELLKKKIIKENIENTLSKLDSSDEKVIDMLDLNVRKVKKKSPLRKRRHSIEKFPISEVDSPEAPVPQLLFNHLPRSISPRSKRQTKGAPRRSSPYSTRSDSPARMLRNGKQRKLKDMSLLEGLDADPKKRRRLCSDLSGSEMSVSRSGYESDSSFSDLASLIGGENDSKDLDAKPKEAFDADQDVSTPATREAPSTNANGPSEMKLIDTNSNVCNNLNPAEDVKKELPEDSALYPISPSVKVPEKSIILDIMKQTFNDVSEDKALKPAKKASQKPNFEAETVVVSKFYGKSPASPPQEEESNNIVPQPMETDVPVAESLEEPPPTCPAEEPAVEAEKPSLEPLEEFTNPPEPMTVDSEARQEDAEEPKGVEPAVEVPTDDSASDPLKSSVCAFETNEIGDKTPEQFEPERTVIDSVLESLVEEVMEEDDRPSEMPVLEKEDIVRCDVEEVTGGCSQDANVTDLNGAAGAENAEEAAAPSLEETAEELAEKEHVLKVSARRGVSIFRAGPAELEGAAEEAKQKTREKPSAKNDKDNYTGTLKTVIKINRDKKKGRNSLKMTLQKNKTKSSEGDQGISDETNYKIMKDGGSATWKHGNHSSDTAGAHRKSHYSNRSNMDGSSEHTSDGEAASQDGAIKALVIPEKASSFSIHPGRLCKDECSYCFGKFGLFDTPCHIAQMKTVERQNKILAIEKHLTRDSCLCDACYRHVDRKANTPSYTNKSLKRNSLVAPGPRQNHCHVLGSTSTWTTPASHSIPICDEHYSALEHLMVCAMCKRRLARNHIHYLGPETNDLNNALNDEGIPLMLTDKPVVCKLCKCFASIILKDPEERPENSANFFREYKRRENSEYSASPLQRHRADGRGGGRGAHIGAEQVREARPVKKKSKKLSKSANDSGSQTDSQEAGDNAEKGQERLPSVEAAGSQPQSRSESPSDEYNGVDYNTLIPSIAMECGSDTESKKEPRKPPIVIKKILPRMESHEKAKDAVEISKVVKPISIDKARTSDMVVARLGSNPSISVRQLFPARRTCRSPPTSSSTTRRTARPRAGSGAPPLSSTTARPKRLWQELQKPYGNQSSFLRHLILLEKYFRYGNEYRNGDLVLSPNASHHSVNYSESVHNRLRAYDNIPTNAGNIQPISMIPFNKAQQKSSSGIITSANVAAIPVNHSPAVSVTTIPGGGGTKSAPLTLSQLNSPPLIPANAVLQQVRPKMVPQSQKIKFPITKNWRPNLIPIDPGKKQERKAGLVQVISGGKPYHITLEDYKKMCAIKRSFEMKQKRLQEAQNAKPILVTHNSVLKSIIPRKGLIISKTATVTSPAGKAEAAAPQGDAPVEGENILEKLDKQVEKLESKLNEKPASSSLLLPKIPKSLTVIPQTVTKKSSRPSSPVLVITPKSNANKS